MVWASATFLRAAYKEPIETDGYVHLGLGLSITAGAGDKTIWNLTHLGSGHLVAKIRGTVKNAFPIATEIAEAGDWDFDGLYGWKNRDRDFPAKIRAVMAKHSRCTDHTTADGSKMSEECARIIAQQRAGGDHVASPTGAA